MRPVALFLILVVVAAMGCDDLSETREDTPDLEPDGGDPGDLSEPWSYPYYLIIGGGISETLSILTVKGPGEFSVANDVQDTCASINEMHVRDGELYALCSLSNSVVVYDTSNLSINREISVGVGTNPINFAFHEGSRALISNFLEGTLSDFDLDDGSDHGRLTMPTGVELPRDDSDTAAWPRPGAVVWDGDHGFVVLANLSAKYTPAGPGLLLRITHDPLNIGQTIELAGRDTTGLYLDRDAGRLWVVSAGDYTESEGFVGNGVIEELNADTLETERVIDIGGAPFGEIVVAPNGKGYAGNGREAVVLVFDTETGEALPSIDIRDPDDDLGLSFASAVAVDGNGYLYATDFNHDRLFVIDTDTDEIVAGFDVNDGPDVLGFIR